MSSDDINASIQKLNEELKIFRERWPGIKSQIANALNEFARAKPQLTQIAEDFSRIPAIFGNLRNLFRSFWESWMHAEYVETGNPLFVWDVYRSHRSRGENPPEWILEYFDRCGWNLHNLEHDVAHGKKLMEPSSAIAQAFLMKAEGRSGGGHVFTKRLKVKDTPALMIALLVLGKIDQGLQKTIAIEDVAKEFRFSETTIRKRCEKAAKTAGIFKRIIQEDA